jgi:hypothetical protein
MAVQRHHGRALNERLRKSVSGILCDPRRYCRQNRQGARIPILLHRVRKLRETIPKPQPLVHLSRALKKAVYLLLLDFKRGTLPAVWSTTSIGGTSSFPSILQQRKSVT